MDVIQPASVSALTTLAHTLTTLAHALIQVLHAIKPWLAPFAIPLLAIVYAQILDLYDSFCIERSFFRNLKVLVNPAQKNFFFKRGFVDELKHKIIPTNSLTSKYLVVTGAHGNGKSSMVHHIVDELTNGVHYVACPSNAMRFGEAFSDSISYSSMYRPSVIRQAFQASSLLTSPMRYNGRSFIPIFEACLNKYTRAAARYTRITGKVPILVIDAINRFTTTKEGSSFLMELQMLAKDWADTGLIRVIFVTSEGKAMYIMQQQSAQTRAEVVTIEDMSHPESLAFLKHMCGTAVMERYNPVEVDDLLRELVAGRTMMLRGLSELMIRNGDLSDFKKYALNFAQQKFLNCGLFVEGTPRFERSRQLTITILTNPSFRVSERMARRILGDTETYALMRESNFFNYFDSDNTIRFASNACLQFAVSEFQASNRKLRNF